MSVSEDLLEAFFGCLETVSSVEVCYKLMAFIFTGYQFNQRSLDAHSITLIDQLGPQLGWGENPVKYNYNQLGPTQIECSIFFNQVGLDFVAKYIQSIKNPVSVAFGRNKSIARNAAADKLYDLLSSNGLSTSEIDLIKSKRVLDELDQKLVGLAKTKAFKNYGSDDIRFITESRADKEYTIVTLKVVVKGKDKMISNKIFTADQIDTPEAKKSCRELMLKEYLK